MIQIYERVPLKMNRNQDIKSSCRSNCFYFYFVFLAAVSVFLSSIVIVIGPTPPGTGVI